MNIRKSQIQPGLTWYDLSTKKILTRQVSGDYQFSTYTKFVQNLTSSPSLSM